MKNVVIVKRFLIMNNKIRNQILNGSELCGAYYLNEYKKKIEIHSKYIAAKEMENEKKNLKLKCLFDP